MSWVRIFELASDYGMRGPEFAHLLRSLGFANIKSHMTKLDVTDQLIVAARLDAVGMRRGGEKKALPDAKLASKLRTSRASADPAAFRLPRKSLPRHPRRFYAPQGVAAKQAEMRGLRPLAEAFQSRRLGEQSLKELAAPYVSDADGLRVPEQVLEGVLHLLADQMVHARDVRRSFREALQNSPSAPLPQAKSRDLLRAAYGDPLDAPDSPIAEFYELVFDFAAEGLHASLAPPTPPPPTVGNALALPAVATTRRPLAPPSVPQRTALVLDGSNIAHDGYKHPSLRRLLAAVAQLQQEFPQFLEITTVVDANLRYKLDADDRSCLLDLVSQNQIVEPPAGTRGKGDAFLLGLADRFKAVVLSNDSFCEFHETHPWLLAEQRVLGGRWIAARKVWHFEWRIPVRSRE